MGALTGGSLQLQAVGYLIGQIFREQVVKIDILTPRNPVPQADRYCRKERSTVAATFVDYVDSPALAAGGRVFRARLSPPDEVCTLVAAAG